MSTATFNRTLIPAPEHADIIDVLLVAHGGLPHGQLGELRPPAGRLLLRQAAAALRGVDVSHRVVTDPHKRWQWPSLHLFGSVSHTGSWSATALTCESPVGIDLQDSRHRPGAMAFVADLIGRRSPLTYLEYAECESLIKVSELTKETFGSVRLPEWRPGWRPAADHWIRSLVIPDVGALAIASPEPRLVRWWRATSHRVGALGETVELPCLDGGMRPCQQ